MIELNPFSPTATGSFLFDWKSDLNLLWGKTTSEFPVFRCRTMPRNDMHLVSLLPYDFEKVIEKALFLRRKSMTQTMNEISEKQEGLTAVRLNSSVTFFAKPQEETQFPNVLENYFTNALNNFGN